MFYKYNAFTGRIGQSTQQQAYLPQGFQPEVPKPVISVRTKAVDSKKMTVAPIKAETSGVELGRIPIRKPYQQLLKWQKWFQSTELEMVWQVCTRAKAISYTGMAVASVTLALGSYELFWNRGMNKK